MFKNQMRILLKISGESLGDQHSPWHAKNLQRIIRAIQIIHDAGHQVAVVVGGGNIWRYRDHTHLPLPRLESDFLGMHATLFNANCLHFAAQDAGLPSAVFSRIKCSTELAMPYSRSATQKAMRSGQLIFLAGGTGQSGFSTDTAAALAAADLQCDQIWKATKVDGVFTSDPLKNPKAKHLPQLTYASYLRRKLKVMDQSAIETCQKNHIPIRIYRFCLRRTRALSTGGTVGSLIH